MSKVKDLKKDNIQKVRKCFYDCQVWTKNTLSKETQLSLSATTNILQELMAHKEIQYIGESQSTGGRKSKEYLINKDYYCTANIILKRNKKMYEMTASIRDLMGNEIKNIVLKSEHGTLRDLDYLLEKVFMVNKNISLLVFSIPGVCSQGRIDICDYEKLIGIDLQSYIYDKYQVESIIENDVNVACIGFSKQYPDVSHLAFLYQPEVEYTGCGMIIEGQLYNGFSHYAGELRFLPFTTPKEQLQMLKENPQELLMKQIVTLCAVMNPEVIGYCSDRFESLELLLSEYGIKKDHAPKLIAVNNFNEMVQKGLYLIGLKKLEEREGQKNG